LITQEAATMAKNSTAVLQRGATRSILNESRLRRLLEPLFDELGQTNRDRLRRLLPLFSDGKAKLSECLQDAFPGRNQRSAQEQFRNFRKAVNDAARAAEVGVVFQVDTSKRTSVEARSCWFEGDPSTEQELVNFSSEGAVSTTLAEIENRALVTTGSAALAGPQPVRIFVSYSHEDEKYAMELVERIKTHWRALSQGSQNIPMLEMIWVDWYLEAGEKFDQRIHEEMSRSQIGLFLISTDSLASNYINEVELPHFQNEEKRIVPIRFGPVADDAPMLKSLRGTYQFVELATGNKVLSYLDARTDHNRQAQFVDKVVRGISTGLISLRTGEQLDARSPKAKLFSRLVDLTKEIGVYEGRYEPNEATRVGLAELERLDLSKDLPEGRVGKAVEMIEEWALNPESSPFFAVLGEYGIGKTTTLKELTRRLLDHRKQNTNSPLPIFIDLGLYYNEGTERKVPTLEVLLSEVIRSHWKGGSRPALTPEEIIDAVQNEQALIIFDGLDEKIVHYTPEETRQFIRELWRVLPPKKHRIEVQGKAAKSDGKRGKVIFSCRSHYFRDVVSQNAMLTGEFREGIKKQDYDVCIILPFNEGQIRHYLTDVLGDEGKADAALELFASIHNLTELARRPFLLELISGEIEELERRRARGDKVTGVTLYEQLTHKWLNRDDPKHTFTHGHKLLMMEQIAADMTRSAARAWNWEKVEQWLTDFLHHNSAIGSRYQNIKPEVLNEDFRTATFVLRPDNSKDQFRFAHSSLQEFFHARRLVRGLREDDLESWAIDLPSLETLDFVGQLLVTEADLECVASLERCLSQGEPRAARLAFRYWLRAIEHSYPEPQPQVVDLSGLDLQGWNIVGESNEKPLFMGGAKLTNALLDNARLTNVYLGDADLSGASCRWAEFQKVNLRAASLGGTNFSGTTLRECVGTYLDGRRARWYDADWILSDLSRSKFASDFNRNGTMALCIVDQTKRKMQWEKDSALEISFRQGHSSEVSSCAWSPDGRQLVSGSDDSTLQVWNSESAKCVRELKGHCGRVSSCAWSPDGQQVVSGGDDQMLRVWDVKSGKCVLELKGHSSGVTSCAWSSNGRQVMSGGYDATVRVWDVQGGKCVQELKGHSGGVTGCAWSPDGRQVVTGSDDKTVRVWDVVNGKCVRELKGNSGSVSSCAWSPDGRQVVSGSYDHRVRVWDVESGKCVREFKGHGGRVKSCAWSPRGRQVLTGSADGTVRVWDVESGKCVRELGGHGRGISSCAWSPDGRQVVSGGGDWAVRVWDAQTGKCEHEMKGHSDWVMSCAWSPDGRQVAMGSDDQTVRVWNAENWKCERELKGRGWVRSCAWSPDGRQVVTGSDDKTLRVWDVESVQCMRELKGHSGLVMSCAWSPDGRQVVSGGDDKTVRVWDAQSGKCVQLRGHGNEVMSCAWSPDGRRVVSGSYDHTVRVWDVESGKCVRELKGHTSGVTSCAWSPNGRQVVSGSFDQTMRVWDAESWKCVRKLKGHSGWVRSCAWSPDGRQVVSSSDDQTVRLWDPRNGKCVRELKGHSGSVIGCAWSPDGRQVVSGSYDGTVRTWDAQKGKCTRTLTHIRADECVALDLDSNQILWASPGAWRYLGWQVFDPEANRLRRLPAEIFGPLPG
jgi:WD40 repeat protein